MMQLGTRGGTASLESPYRPPGGLGWEETRPGGQQQVWHQRGGDDNADGGYGGGVGVGVVGVNATSSRRDERQGRLGRASGKHWPQHPRRQQRRGGGKAIGEAGIEPQPPRTVGKAPEPSSPPPLHPTP